MSEALTYVFIQLGGAFVPAGRLVMNDDERRDPWASFAYGREYLRRPDRIAVDPVQLPLGTDEYFTQEGCTTFGAIDDASPDGWGKYLMYKAMEDRTPTDIEAILASGPERVGALAFGPTPAQPERIIPWREEDAADAEFSLEELAAATGEALHADRLNPRLRALLTAGSSLGGARPKGVTVRDGVKWIAKFPARNDAVPECRAEYAAMSLASRIGLDVPPLALTSAAGRDIYLIKRFDRTADGAPDGGSGDAPVGAADGDRRLHFVSGLTMLAAHESEAHRHGYADLAQVLRIYGSDPARDLHELFRRMVFNILVTNDDDHLRNHGFLLDTSGWRLSPLYDVVPKPQIGYDRRLALAAGPEGRAATLANAVAGAASFDLHPGEASAIAADMAGAVAQGWEDAFRDAGLAAADRGRFATCFRMSEAAVHGL